MSTAIRVIPGLFPGAHTFPGATTFPGRGTKLVETAIVASARTLTATQIS